MKKKRIKMTDFTKILDKAKELEAKMKESQEKIKEIRAEGVSGSNSVQSCSLMAKVRCKKLNYLKKLLKRIKQ
jgi:DNA-binding protein YbaB